MQRRPPLSAPRAPRAAPPPPPELLDLICFSVAPARWPPRQTANTNSPPPIHQTVGLIISLIGGGEPVCVSVSFSGRPEWHQPTGSDKHSSQSIIVSRRGRPGCRRWRRWRPWRCRRPWPLSSAASKAALIKRAAKGRRAIALIEFSRSRPTQRLEPIYCRRRRRRWRPTCRPQRSRRRPTGRPLSCQLFFPSLAAKCAARGAKCKSRASKAARLLGPQRLL